MSMPQGESVTWHPRPQAGDLRELPVGAVDAEHAELFAEVCSHALMLVESARVLTVIATGEYLAEVPGRELEFWALGATKGAALKELLRIVSAALQKRLRLKGVHESHERHE